MVKHPAVLPLLVSFLVGFLLVAAGCEDQSGGYPTPSIKEVQR